MKLSQLEERIQQTLQNLKKRIQKWPILLPRSGRDRSTRGQANEAWAMYKSTPSRVSWGDPSSETEGRSVGSEKTAAGGRERPWNATLNEAVLQLIRILVFDIFVPNCRPESIALLLWFSYAKEFTCKLVCSPLQVTILWTKPDWIKHEIWRLIMINSFSKGCDCGGVGGSVIRSVWQEWFSKYKIE